MLRLVLGILTVACFADFASSQGSRVCAGCHAKVWETYRNTGMARSFSRTSVAEVARDVARDSEYFHEASNTHFTMTLRDGAYYQRGYQLDSVGRQINITEKRVDYVMGSGNHAKTYLTRTSGNTLMELPLGWYAEKGGYLAMNPGYDRPNHDGFRRPITYDCMFCHNAYPRIPAGNEQPFAESVYSGQLPEGIDCQRCHGSGTRHVQLAGSAGAKREEIRKAILNPARLSAEQQMEGCMVCHLETTSFALPNAIQRFERKAFSYQPGEPLADFILNFDHAPEAGRDDKFEIVNAAYRLRRSECFLKSPGKLVCTTCHNPHDVPRGQTADQHYTAVCRQCHAEAFQKLVNAGKHTAGAGCIECHMPKRRTEDVIHVAATDHLIQRRKPEGDLLAERAERQDAYRGRVVPYYPQALPETAENALTAAVAQVIQGSNLAEGIAQLTLAIDKYKPQRAEYYLHLADALQSNGRLAQAMPVYREAVRHSPKSAVGLQKLGTALRRSAGYAEAEEVLKKSAAVEPARAITWHELGLTYQALRKSREAMAAIGKALEVDPELPEAHNNLGIIRLAAGEQDGAEAAFREAIRIRPTYADAHGNLAGLLSGAGKFADAQAEFETALRLRPTDAGTLYNFAMLLGRTSRFDEAQKELEEALRADSGFADAHLLLGDLLMARQQMREAVPHYREALKVMPQSGRAHLGLGAALLATGDIAGGTAELKSAADGADAVVAAQATEMIRQTEKR